MPAAPLPKNGTARHLEGHKTRSPLDANAHVRSDAVTSGDKKRKKKKRRPKAAREEDELLSLETCNGTPRSRTGLCPELESVHLSTTASLSNMSFSGNKAQLNMSPAAQDDLLSELYHKVGFDAADSVTDEIRDSLNSVPGGMRAFVQSALSSMANLGLGADEIKQRALYAIAQQMLQSGMGGRGIGVGAGKGDMDDASLSFEPGSLPDFPINQALERLMSGKGVFPMRHGQALHADVMLSHEFLDEDGCIYEDELYSEDEVDEGVEELDMHMRMGIEQMQFRGEAGALPDSEHCSVSYEGELVPLEGAFTPLNEAGGWKKKSKRKKKKSGVARSIEQLEAPAVPRPQPRDVPAVPVAHPAVGLRPEGVTYAVTHSQTAPNPPPAHQNAVMPTRPAATLPPSSRAAGKQPMNYVQPPAATTNPAATPNPPRSARAAAKAPAHQQPYSHTHAHHHPSPPSSNASAPQKHRPPASGAQNGANANSKPNNKIWSTNSTEERERIKEFWLGLSEEERRALVKVEKEAVLRKMKEQQKHSCTCAVCGRKRNAIEEELEVLYDAYYEELEQYANYQQRYASSGGTLPPPPGPGPFPGSVELDKNGLVVGAGGKTHPLPPSARGKGSVNGAKKIVPPESEFEDDQDADDYEEDEYDEEEDEDDEDDDDADVDADDDAELRNRNSRRVHAARDRGRGAPNGTKANGRDDLFSFGSRLTAAGPGNILTVADDLLKNDGQKFLEMMEQLAERRMQREEDAALDVVNSDEDEDEEDDGEDDEVDEDDEEDEEEDILTEEQKVEEGKRMFSIFAARMFEQRVLSAYREKVAQERQNQLLRELEDEQAASREKEAKKAKENQRKKDKRRQAKLAKDEERAAKAAQQAAEEAARKEQQKREDDARAEAKRKEREAIRKAAEEAKQRKKENQIRWQQEQAERERKLLIERREKAERERQAKAEREAKLLAERTEKEKEKAKKEEEKAKREEEKRLTMEQEKAEKERPQQARTVAVAAAKLRTPASPRANASASSSSQRQQQPSTSTVITPKKILNKPSAQPSPAPAPQPTRQPSRSAGPMQLTPPATPQHTAPSPTHSSPVTASNSGPLTPVYPQPTPVPAPPVISPRATFASTPGLPPFSNYMPQVAPPPPIGPPPSLPRPFGAGPPFGLAPAASIGPPKAPIGNPILSPVVAPGPPAPIRRMSGADPGPITRPAAPIAPIARPTNGINGDTSGSGTGSGGASPSRRSPSPKGVLGSSALAADDDEVVTAPGRRSAPVPLPQIWMNPRNVTGPSPWGPPPTSEFPSPRTLSTNVNMGLWGPAGNPPPPVSPSANLNDWTAHPSHPNSHFFGGAPPFLHPAAASPPPHSSGN